MPTPRVLVIDNNASLAETVAEVLAERGFTVHTAFTGVEALALWRREPANLVMVDVDLPDIGGLVLARRLLRRAQGVSLVVMTAGEQERLARLCDELGAALLAKPFSPSGLIATIRRVLERHAAQDPAAATPHHPIRLLEPRCPRALLQHARPLPRRNRK